MMAMLRSRKMMIFLAVLVTVGLVCTGMVGLFRAMSAPSPAENASPENPSTAPRSAPAMDALGTAPSSVEYSDLGEQCDTNECYRIVGITADDLDGAAAVEEVYGHLVDNSWGRMLPKGENDPDEVPLTETVLTNGNVIVQGNSEPYAPETTAGLIVAHAQEPS